MASDSHIQTDLQYTQANSLSDLFAADTADAPHAFILNYPATASWAAYPNTEKYFLQDGSDEATKVSYDKSCSREPWKKTWPCWAIASRGLSSARRATS
ncbi:hypothetical protein [Leptolyngbya sp. O-77]|uniref:hypothetical protein n=1 Tax=Leptolyngbya sp. O-77 TaxID=1080068 RepID=UPI00074D35BD|nr:hypothetical protein [Leptolyngbya sp. O-77]BAU41075.1 hypothetical protein O77CONTIG1_00882 [Leptolyngbya sp. O-77]